jgi:hypothetical protein
MLYRELIAPALEPPGFGVPPDQEQRRRHQDDMFQER